MRDTNIKISPFELLDLIEYESFKKENEHGYVKFSGHISADLEDSYVEMALNDVWAKVTAVDSFGTEKVIFDGVVTDLNVTTKNGVKLLTVILRSGSYLMDMMPHIRSYQNPALMYRSVLSSYTALYPNGKFIMTEGKGQTIPKLILQYQETDWEFTKRLASHFNTIIIPDSKTRGVKYFFGLPEPTETPTVETNFYAMTKRIDEYIYKQKNGVKGIRESDAIYYVVKWRDIYDLGSRIKLNGHNLYVSAIDTKLEGSELYHTYFLKNESGAKVPKAYNLNAIGASLYASILAVEKDVVQISIDKDENQKEAGVNWYPYNTVYSTPDGTGWYCMPEIGDAVRFYVPNYDESEAYVISSTHLQSSAPDERVNPDYKSIMNKYGKEILFKPDSLIFTNNAGMSIEILDEEGIRILSNKAILIKSEDTVDISSVTSTLQVIAPDSILLKQGDTITHLQDNIVFNGSQIHMD